MVGFVTGNGLGLERSSAYVLGARGIIGSAVTGRAGENAFVNIATGNLIVQNRDEFLTAVGVDAAIARTYNSLGTFTDENGDNWRQSNHKNVSGLTGTLNTANSTVTRTEWDGSSAVFTYDTTLGVYVNKDGAGAYDTIVGTTSTWTWKDGNSRVSESYDRTASGRITSSTDVDGNITSYTYTGAVMTKITTHNSVTGQDNFTTLVYSASNVNSGKNLLRIETSYYDTVSGTNKVLTRTRYSYDSSHRMTKVQVDLSPGDNAVSDGKVYETTYTYDGTSKRILTISQTDGSLTTFTYDGSFRVATIAQTVDTGVTRTTTLTYGSGTTTITDPDGNATVMNYNASGQLTRLTQPAPVAGGNAQIVDYSYNSNGDVLSATLFDGITNANNNIARSKELNSYDANGNLVEQQDLLGNTVRWTYGSQNELLTRTSFLVPDPDALGSGQPGTPLVTRYIYDDAANLVRDDGTVYTGSDPSDVSQRRLRFAISAEGRVTEYRYNANGLVTSQITYTSEIYTGTTFTEADLSAWIATIAASPYNALSKIERTDTTYDFRGNIATVTTYAKTDASGVGLTSAGNDFTQITYIYDQAGNLLSRQYNDGGTAETFVYDGMGRTIIFTDRAGAQTTTSFTDSAQGTVVTLASGLVQTSLFNKAGELVSFAESHTSITTGTTLYKYDALGRLRIQTSPIGVKSYFLYDNAGRKIADVDADGSLVEYRFDAANRLLATIQYATALTQTQIDSLVDGSGNPTSVGLAAIRPGSTAADRIEWNVYDNADRLVGTIDPTGAVTAFEYDGASRLIKSTQFATKLSSTIVDGYRTSGPPTQLTLPSADAANDRVERTFYDNDGLVAGTLNGDGYLTVYTYDKAGRKTQSSQYTNQPSQALWANGSFADLKTSAGTIFTDIQNFWIYDGRGLLAATMDGLNNVTRYHYTARGDIDQEVRGQNAGNPPYTFANLPAPSGSATLDTTNYVRNGLGQITSRTRVLASGTETTSYTYDNLGNLLSETTSETISSETRTNTNRYDVKGRLTGTLSGVGSAELAALGASPTQTQIDNVYANFGTRYVYDSADFLIAKIDPDGSTGAGNKTLYFYNSDGNLVLEVNALGETTQHQYSVYGDKTTFKAYGTRLSSATMAGWTGGLLTSTSTTVINALTALANTSFDSLTQYLYNVDGTLQQVTDPLGRLQSYIYNSFDEVVSSTSPVDTAISKLTTYSYNRRGQLLSETADAAVGGFNLTRSYGYDSFGRQTSSIDARGFTRLADYNRGHWQKNATDAFGRVSELQYDSRGNTVRSIDRANLSTYFSFDAFNRTIVTTTPESLVSTVKRNAYGQTIEFKDAANRITSYTYDKDGNVKTVTQTPVSGTNLVTTNSYDKAGRLQQTTDARGVITRYTYDAANRVLTRVEDYGTNKLNLTTTYTYDAKGQQISVTDASGSVTTFSYDLAGQQLRVIQDEGSGKLNITTDYTYRADGKVSSVTQAVGTAAAVSTTYEYDVLGRLTRQAVDPTGINEVTVWRHDANGNIVSQTDALGRTTRYVYDAENREIYSVNAEGGVVSTGYDVEGRAIWKKQFFTRIAQATVDGWNASGTWQISESQASTIADANNDRITRTLYDKDGRVAYIVDPEGYVTENRYDAANNIIKTARYATAVAVGDTITKAELATLLPSSIPGSAAQTNYVYDNANRLTDIIDAVGVTRHFVLNATGQIKQEYLAYGSQNEEVEIYRDYDGLGRLKSETRGEGTLEEATTYYSYDALGRVVAITDPRGFITTRTYDALGRMLSETVPLDATTNAVTLRQYDVRGNVVKITDPRGNIGTFYYDKLDRLVLQVDPEGYATKTQYSIGDNIASVKRYYLKATGVGNVDVQPTLTDDAKDATTSFTRDRLDRLTSSTDAEGHSESYTLDAHGNRVQVTNKLGGITDNVFDHRGLLLSETLPLTNSWSDGIARRIVNEYAYDARGNRKEMIEAKGLPEQRATYYEYDKLDRLVQKTGDSVETIGNNLLSLPDAQPKEVTVYDRRGNIKGKADANGNITIFYYDALDRKIAELSPTGTLTRWTYDGNGNVLSERVYADPITGLPSDPNGQTAQVYRLFDIAFGGMPSNSQVTEWVGKMNTTYANFVQPSAEGWPALNPFDGQLNRVQGIATELLADPAVQLRLSATDDALFVTQMFQWAYRRTPSASEATLWEDNLTDGWTRAGMLTYFSENLEHRNIAARLSLTEAAKRTQPAPVSATAYRETLFAYDRNNQQISMTKAGVRTGSFNGSTYPWLQVNLPWGSAFLWRCN